MKNYLPLIQTLGRAVAGAAILGLAATASGSVVLNLPQSTAFGILGHSCGGIQEQSYASGFDAVTGYPVGNVYMQTRCGGSGRGGGYKTTTYSAWAAVMWDFSGKVLAATRLTTAPGVNGSFTVSDAFGDSLSNSGGLAYLAVPVPSAPADVAAVQAGDQFQVSWTALGVNPEAVTSSTLLATPVSSPASIVTAVVSGPAENGLLGPLQPLTTYEITVVNATIAGSGPASAPITVTTEAASVAPSAPTGVAARWGAQYATTAALLATWNAAVPGDSPIDQYEVTITGSDGGGTFDQTVSGATLSTSFTVDFIPDWSVQVRAHNAVGWGPWSALSTLGGL